MTVLNLKDQSFYLFVDKPKGVTSQRVLTQIKKKLNIKKIGHHGTLDPFATGLLLVGVNEATKFFRFIDDSKKTYKATLKLGEETDTLDIDGEVINKIEIPEIQKNEITKVLNSFLGESEQTPPMYSAIKVNGKKLYELARKGEVVERKKRIIEIHDIELLSYKHPYIEFRATVSRGTYIRSLALDIAQKLNSCGHLVELRRTHVCGSDESQSISLENIDDHILLQEKMSAIDSLLKHLPALTLSDLQKEKIIQGQCVDLENELSSASFIMLKDKDNHFIGIAKRMAENQIKAERMMKVV